MVYFLSEEEKRYIFRGLLVRARKNSISVELRGWSWDNPPLSPPYDDVFLTLSEVASRYCLTGRDVYLRRVERVKFIPNKRMVRGLVLHSVVERVFIEAKRSIFANNLRNGFKLFEQLTSDMGERLGEVFKSHDELFKLSGYSHNEVEVLKGRAKNLWIFEANQISARMDMTLSKHPYISVDSLVAHTIPVVVEQRLDGRFLGLSGTISSDALSYAPVVLDLKTGKFREFQKLTTTGYALVLESLSEAPIDVGVLVNLLFTDSDAPRIERKPHLISDYLRTEFIEERDRKMEIVAEGIDPGLSPQCPSDCPYYNYCRGESG